MQLDLLTIVSAASPLQEGYVPKLDTVIEEYQLDARCASVCWDMMQDCRAENAGFPMICSAYRTQEFQQELFDNKVVRVMQERYCSMEEAVILASEEVAYPGTSEHQLGLAADIIDETYPYLTEWQETTGTQKWLKEHAADYGFILRYPPESSEITGIIYEPWHYRYVGKKFAHEITNRGMTLEDMTSTPKSAFYCGFRGAFILLSCISVIPVRFVPILPRRSTLPVLRIFSATHVLSACAVWRLPVCVCVPSLSAYE